ncbi:adenosylcobyric acid synthase (glutamine-hydrolysing) [Planomicrobium soli]|uniref:Cobyric acid synthase n=1 Tax=Planomicrobium soli TaxID=1176648 RepID=A0A2P8H322_9BACL|nr:cobyric acid synthase [Planomicrobium soli]PSL40592.1 adenosylcobyric acid synthase (glutamine-hydrolysing) [Planomicrobium soli]
MRGIMIQGTASDVGKSLICTAFCRILSDQGICVAPFKSQNMSNNSYVTVLGEEIGRAQGVQAEAARTVATVDMNPILMKPESDMKSQVILFGKKIQTMDGMDYRTNFYEQGLAAIDRALENLSKSYTHLVIEGAGSPAEVNLNDREIVNMAVAERADVPVILVADIERGGVFASIVGTLALMPNPERVKGLIINKFRGDLRLFEDGVAFLEAYTKLPVLGVIPYFGNHEIEQEDSLGVRELTRGGLKRSIDMAVLKHPYLSNFTDIEPFLNEPDVAIRWVDYAEDIGQPDILVFPGTKNTIADLRYWKRQGLEGLLLSLGKGTRIIGLCGGFQMLGDSLADPHGFDGTKTEFERGLGLISGMSTHFIKEKFVRRRTGTVELHEQTFKVDGYEIHTGRSSYGGKPLVSFKNETEGIQTERLIGTHLHGFFDASECRRAFLAPLRQEKKLAEPILQERPDRYSRFAAHVKAHIDWARVEQIMEDKG